MTSEERTSCKREKAKHHGSTHIAAANCRNYAPRDNEKYSVNKTRSTVFAAMCRDVVGCAARDKT
eukprot:scaffold53525_cov31-Tisochrysis_lutea.AAC.3